MLLLFPPRAHEQEVRLLAAIARLLVTAEDRERVRAARAPADIVALMRGRAAAPAPIVAPHRTSLADL